MAGDLRDAAGDASAAAALASAAYLEDFGGGFGLDFGAADGGLGGDDAGAWDDAEEAAWESAPEQGEAWATKEDEEPADAGPAPAPAPAQTREVIELLSSDDDGEAGEATHARAAVQRKRQPTAADRRRAVHVRATVLLCGLARGNQLVMAATALASRLPSIALAKFADDTAVADDDAKVVRFLASVLAIARGVLASREFAATQPSADGWADDGTERTREDVVLDTLSTLQSIAKGARKLAGKDSGTRHLPLGARCLLNALASDHSPPLNEEAICVLVAAALRANDPAMRVRIVKVHRPTPALSATHSPRRPSFAKPPSGCRGRWIFAHAPPSGLKKRRAQGAVGTFVPALVENTHLAASATPLGCLVRRAYAHAAAAAPEL